MLSQFAGGKKINVKADPIMDWGKQAGISHYTNSLGPQPYSSMMRLIYLLYNLIQMNMIASARTKITSVSPNEYDGFSTH